MPGVFGFITSYGARSGGGASVPRIRVTGTPPDVVIGSPYNFQWTVSPDGSPVTFPSELLARLALYGITDNGLGLWTTSGANVSQPA